MRANSHLLSLGLGLLALAGLACGTGGVTGTAGAGASSGKKGSGPAPIFDGVGTAGALSPTEVAVSWSDAINGQGDPNPQSIVYRVFRAFDSATVLLESSLVQVTAPGVTSFVDRGLPPTATIFYRVVAVDPAGRRSTSARLATARTPAPYGPGLVDYNRDVAGLWNSSTLQGGGQTCLDCHTAPGPNRLDLSTWQGVNIGTGTLADPDSFVVAYNPEETWAEFLLRFTANRIPHHDFLVNPTVLATFEPVLKSWVAEGALEFPDATPPVFRFEDIGNAGLYFGEFVDFNTVRVTWFHADDPESLPFTGSTENQLDYRVYAGRTSQTIDWDNPVAVLRSPEKTPANPTISVEFAWPFDTVAVIVRAVDASGRSTGQIHNESVNEREIQLAR